MTPLFLFFVSVDNPASWRGHSGGRYSRSFRELVELGSAFEAELALHKEAKKRVPLSEGLQRKKKRRVKSLWG